MLRSPLVQERPYKSPDIVRFLKQLLRHIPGKLLVLWDGAPIHRGQPVKDFLAHGGSRRIRLEQLPGYAPDLNPDEGIWSYLKRLELGNVRCQNLPTSGASFGSPPLASATSGTSSKAACESVVTMFRHPYGDQ